jgi:hypothetical protein
MEPMPGTRFRPYPLCLVVPTACMAAGSWYVSGRRWGQIEDHVADATAAPLQELSSAMADQAVGRPARGPAGRARGAVGGGGSPRG